MKNVRVPVLIKHDAARGPIGFLELADVDALKLIQWSDVMFAPGYIKNKDGSVELLEISVIIAPPVNREFRD